MRALAYILIGIIISMFGLILFRSPEDSWICKDGAWVKHGNPTAAKPTVSCPKKGGTMKFVSPAFSDNGTLPAVYTCQGQGASPPFTIAQVPAGTRSLALTMDDPDAPGGIFHHWLVFNITPQTTEITEDHLPPGSIVGANSTGASAYTAACPPGGIHRYVFTLFALDSVLNLEPTASRSEFDSAIRNHTLEKVTLTASYGRK